jgi:hypothetical protein
MFGDRKQERGELCGVGVDGVDVDVKRGLDVRADDVGRDAGTA